MHLFYAPHAALGTTLLGEEESAHCSKVLRMQAGEQILITDGEGMLYEAVVDVPHPKKTSVVCLRGRQIDDKENHRIHIALAPTKHIDRTEWFIEKATEIGIGTISLFFSEHSERRILRENKLLKTAIAAMKQSMKARLPKIRLVGNLGQVIENAVEDQRFIAWIDATVTQLLVHSIQPEKSVLVLIGPEGDFSPVEVKMATEHGFTPVSLGPSRLRTETAALVACHSVHLVNQLKKQLHPNNV